MSILIKASLAGLLLFFCSTESKAAEHPMYPSSPHRVLRVEGDSQTYYLLEKGHPMKLELTGPSLLELKLRRVIFPGEQGVQPSVIRVILDEEIQAPIAFRRTREEKVNFVDENRFLPSASRSSKIAIETGEHVVQLSTGSNTSAVVIALMEQTPNDHMAQNNAEQLPALEPLTKHVRTTHKKARQKPEPVVKRQPKEHAQIASALAASATSQHENQKQVSPTEKPALSEPPQIPQAPQGLAETMPQKENSAEQEAGANETLVKPDKHILQIGLALGLSNNFIGLGNMSPAFHLGLRYPLPGLDNKLQLQLNIELNRYAMTATQGGDAQLQLQHWILPISLGAAYQVFQWDVWQIECGAALGFAPNSSNGSYRQKDLNGMGVGATGLIWSELAWAPSFGEIFIRGQVDAISASNAVLPNAYFTGMTAMTGYRVNL